MQNIRQLKWTMFALTVIAITCCCSDSETRRLYTNPDIGLTMAYPLTWQVMERIDITEAIASAKEMMDFSEEDCIGLDEIAERSSIILSLVKARKISGINKNASVNVVVVPMSPLDLQDIELSALVNEQCDLMKSSMGPDASVTQDRFPIPDQPEVYNIACQFSLKDCEVACLAHVTMYEYLYPPYLCQITFTYLHQDDEKEVMEIISSFKFEWGDAVLEKDAIN